MKSLKIAIGAAFCFSFMSCTPGTQSASSNLDNRLFGIWQDTTTSIAYQDVFSFSDDGRMVHYDFTPSSNYYTSPRAYEWWTIENMLYWVEINGDFTRVYDYEVNGNWLKLYPNTNTPRYLKKQ